MRIGDLAVNSASVGPAFTMHSISSLFDPGPLSVDASLAESCFCSDFSDDEQPPVVCFCCCSANHFSLLLMASQISVSFTGRPQSALYFRSRCAMSSLF